MTSSNYEQFTIPFSAAEIPQLYADWGWLIDQKYLGEPWLMSSFGDLFFKGPDSSIHFIDSIEGVITPFAQNEEDAKLRLKDPATVNRFLSSETVELLRERNIVLKEDELYIYVPHPMVVGSVAIDSIQVMSTKVVISLNGQLLRQILREQSANE